MRKKSRACHARARPSLLILFLLVDYAFWISLATATTSSFTISWRDAVCNATFTTTKSHGTTRVEAQMYIKSSIVEHEYIVSFNQQLPQSEHHRIISQVLGQDSEGFGWKIIERHNPAAQFPSDFALVRFISSDEAAIRLLLQKGKGIVKHVTPHRKLVGALKQQAVERLPEEETQPSDWSVVIPGRAHAPFPAEDFSLISNASHTSRRLFHSAATFQVPYLLNADYLWDKGYTGTGVRVGIFDTGLRQDHPHFRHVVERTNWTDEDTLDDTLGHGTFVAGVVASHEECLGIAPDVALHIFRVFTKDRVSYTSWFLDSFNYAIHTRINVLNLSIGGPDFMDRPFVEKVWELSANNIIVVSAIGNDGPLYGTLNNPADQNDVIGVGGIDFTDKLASFSSRGMTTWELPAGYGRVKPDIVAYSHAVSGSRPAGGCRSLSGTSVASPVVAGAVALLASAVPADRRWQLVNPASMKQALIESAEPLGGPANMFEQGFGKLNLLGAYGVLRNYSPRASFAPAAYDLTAAGCPYMWPYCSQPLYHSAMPVVLNVTILNGMGVTGSFAEPPRWIPGTNGEHAEVAITFPEHLWPWSGWLAVHIRVAPSAQQWDGIVEGVVAATVISPPGVGETTERRTQLELPVRFRVVPRPPREKRVLWDQFHNLRYPSGYFPRDVLTQKTDPFDWNGDHPHTNFRELYTTLRRLGYFVEVLGEPFTCFDARNYGTLVIADPEEEYFPEEVAKLQHDVQQHGLSVAVFADWYDTEVMKKIKFFDENTRQWWTPATGGANVPALNDLLLPYAIQLGDRVYDGEFQIGNSKDGRLTGMFASGTVIAQFPKGGSLVSLPLFDQSLEVMKGSTAKDVVAVLGLLQLPPGEAGALPGRIAVFGDSSCVDDATKKGYCFWLLEHILRFTSTGALDPLLDLIAKDDGESGVMLAELLDSQYVSPLVKPPLRLEGSDLAKFSKVLGHALPACLQLDFVRYNQSDTAPLDLRWDRREYARGSTVPQPELLYTKPQESFAINASGTRPTTQKDATSARGKWGAIRPIGFIVLLLGIVVTVVVVLRKRNGSKRPIMM